MNIILEMIFAPLSHWYVWIVDDLEKQFCPFWDFVLQWWRFLFLWRWNSKIIHSRRGYCWNSSNNIHGSCISFCCKCSPATDACTVRTTPDGLYTHSITILFIHSWPSYQLLAHPFNISLKWDSICVAYHCNALTLTFDNFRNSHIETIVFQPSFFQVSREVLNGINPICS